MAQPPLRIAGLYALCIAAPLLAASCAKPVAPPAPEPPPPTVLDVGVAAAPDLNPDAQGRPSPVVARLYELNSLAAFQGADFFALSERDKDTLGPELVAREELRLMPGEQRRFKRTLDPATRFVGVMAAYRDIERAHWRASMPVPPNATTEVTISVRAGDITIGPK